MPLRDRPRSATAGTATDEQVLRARREWSDLAARLQTVTPKALGRGLVAAGAAAVIAWLAVATWPTLLPYALGATVAYAVYPLVGQLDRFMPRLLAAALATVFGFALIGAVLAIVVPPLVQQAIALATSLPGSSDVARIRTEVNDYLATLPDTPRSLLRGVLDRMAAQVSSNTSGILDGVAAYAVDSITHLFATIGTILGALLLPLWILYIVRDGNQVTQTVANQFSPGVRTDVLALLRIIDRAAGAFVRAQVSGAFLTGAGIWLGMILFERLGVATYNRELAVAALAGLVQVIPQVGWILGLAPAAIAFAAHPDQPVVPLSYLVLYVAVLRLVYLTVGQRMGRVLSIRSSVAVPAVVLLSGLGLVPLLLSAPLLVIGRDTVLYLRGRLAEPAQPAGVLPGETQQRPRPATAPVPPFYQNAALARPGVIVPAAGQRRGRSARGEAA